MTWGPWRKLYSPYIPLLPSSLPCFLSSFLPSFHLPSGKALPARKPPLQPKPVVITTVPVPPSAMPPSTTVLLQPLVQPPPGTEEGKEAAGWTDPPRELTAPEALGCSGVDTGPHVTYSCLTAFSCSLAPVSPVVLLQGAIQVQPEGPAPPAPRPERKSIVPAPMPGSSCPPEVDVSTGEWG